MPKITVVLTGDKELDKKLRRLKSTEAKAVFRKAARKTIKPHKERVKSSLPKKTGLLQKSTKVKSLKRSRQSIGVKVEVKQPYAAPVDLGSKWIKNPTNSIRKNANRYRAAVQRLLGRNIAKEITALAKK